jgi:hypothetical protein
MSATILKSETRILKSRVAQASRADAQTQAALRRARQVGKARIAAEMATLMWELALRDHDEETPLLPFHCISQPAGRRGYACRRGELGRKIKNVAHRGGAERVDRLGVIADHGQPATVWF